MFCSNCGENLISTNQRFCQKCGTEVLATSKTTDYKTERTQNITEPKIYYVPVKQHRQIQRGSPGIYSKLCLGLAFGSIIIGIVSLVIGYNILRSFYWEDFTIPGRLMLTIVLLLLRVGGLTMGVFSRVNGSKAELLEPLNDTEKAGSIFAIFGIIINSIGLLLSLVGPWSIVNIPYW